MKKIISSEGPSSAPLAQPNKPSLIIPSMPIPRPNQEKKGGTKRGATLNRGNGAKIGKHSIFRPPGPAPPPPGI